MSNTEKKCPSCTGQKEPFALNQYCEKHDVCITCGVARKGLGHTPWGVMNGAFQCNPCVEKERSHGIETRRAKGFEHDHTDEVTCPSCGYEFSDSWEFAEGEHRCDECGDDFTVERIVSCSYSTTKKEASA